MCLTASQTACFRVPGSQRAGDDTPDSMCDCAGSVGSVCLFVSLQPHSSLSLNSHDSKSSILDEPRAIGKSNDWGGGSCHCCPSGWEQGSGWIVRPDKLRAAQFRGFIPEGHIPLRESVRETSRRVSMEGAKRHGRQQQGSSCCFGWEPQTGSSNLP